MGMDRRFTSRASSPSTHRLVCGDKMKILNRLPGLPVERTLKALSGRWKAVILYALVEGPHRTCELENRIVGISQKVLLEQLRALEVHGLVSRRPSALSRQGVEYTLTTLGQSLRPVLTSLIDWGIHHAIELHEERHLVSCDAVVQTHKKPASQAG